MQIRTRSGGHDFEGRSYVSEVPFVILDLLNFSEVTVDLEQKTAWVGGGATIGMLYFNIGIRTQTLAFPAGFSPTVGVGGHFSGGGWGVLLRKYGLAPDNIVDARIIDVNGRILDRNSMGEDLFWARDLWQNATQLVHCWQYVAPNFTEDLFIRVITTRNTSNWDGKMTIRATFNSVFLGDTDSLLAIMQEKIPELGLVREDCTEMSWIQSILYNTGLPIDSLLPLIDRYQDDVGYFKGKSDYVQEPIPIQGFEGIWRRFFEPEGKLAQLLLTPYGGKMAQIPDNATPFPHRAGYLYKIHHMVYWEAYEAAHEYKYINWITELYNYVTPYVTSNPRGAFFCYRDLAIGVNNIVGPISIETARVWGAKYFNNNF
ncbi:UNVERIFIED_CONTAM: Berberine bridge enzyme-like 18 [Sesamum indicum]